MLRIVVALVLVALASAAAPAATAPSTPRGLAACAPGSLADPGETAGACEVEGDVALLAAELLVVKFGDGAPEFAALRERRYAAEDDPASAKFWREISDLAAEILKSRAVAGEVSTILSK
jgi:hypothetical protein